MNKNNKVKVGKEFIADIIIKIVVGVVIVFVALGIMHNIEEEFRHADEVSMEELNGNLDKDDYISIYELDALSEKEQDIAWESYQNGLYDGMERTVAINNYGEW